VSGSRCRAKPVPLADLEVLVFDCQATAAFPRGQLLEVGWVRSRAAVGDELRVESHLVAPSGTVRLPRRVRELTGLTTGQLRAAAPARRVGERLASVIAETWPSGASGPRVAVAHFARFEEPFLRVLLSRGGGLPFELLCTHELARRLLPTLPRRGLRAVAGYLGHAVPEPRRARHHVEATVFIWRGLLSFLEQGHAVRSIEDLRGWLAATEPRRPGRVYPMETRIRRELPDGPGLYRFERTDGSVLYVGKATSLRQRVNAYFQTSRGHKERTLEMLAQARAVHVTPTETALEAAVREPDEIKRLHPPYNVALREEDRRLAFWSWTLRHVSLRRDPRHPVGPVLLQAPRPPLAALLALLDGGADRRMSGGIAARVLGVPERYAPAPACFRAGLELFVARHGRWWGSGPPTRSVQRLAARLRRTRIGLAETPLAAAEERPVRAEGWSPERVAGALEDIVSRGAQVIRRARWLCALSECSLSWRSQDAGGAMRGLVLSRGEVVARREGEEAQPPPVPPGHALPLEERQRTLDLAAYDRLSALSRELKALVAGAGPVFLRLGTTTILDRDTLARALRCL
jgi:DNA polymerase-3 subunit epsilon